MLLDCRDDCLVLARLMLARISLASLVQENGREWSIEPSMKALITTPSSFHRGEKRRRMAWKVMIEKKHSTRMSREQPVGGGMQDDPEI